MTARDKALLERILDCLDAIDQYVSRTGASWPTDGMAVDAIAKRLEEIGEIAKRLTPESLAAMPGVNWRGVKGLREVIAHDYDDVDVEVLAGVVRDNLPGLLAAVGRALLQTRRVSPEDPVNEPI